MSSEYRELKPKDIEEMTEIYQRSFQGETIVNICKDLGIDRRTYYRRKDHPQWKKIEKELVDKLIDNAYKGVMETVIAQAMKGSSAHAKLYLDATGKLKSTREVREEEERKRQEKKKNPINIKELESLLADTKERLASSKSTIKRVK
jgi:hypothetical protein